MAVSVYSPTNSIGRFPLLHILSSIYCLDIFYDGHSDWCEVILHCFFIYISLIISDGEHLFMCFLVHLYVFFREMSVWVFCPFLIGLFVFLNWAVWAAFIFLETNPLSVVSVHNYFLPFWGLFFNLVVSFAVQKVLS